MKKREKIIFSTVRPIRFVTILCTVGLIMVFASRAPAPIEYQGTAAEKAELKAAVDDIKGGSADAKALFDGLEASTEKTTVKYGKTDDIATADTTKREITVNKDAVSKITQIDKPGGGGKAGEETKLKYLLTHEAWHIAHPTDTEDQTVSAVNKVEVQTGSVKRKGYYFVKKDGKDTIPYEDGSSADVTESLKASTSTSGGTPGVRFGQEGQLDLQGSLDGSGNVDITLAPSANPQQFQLQFPDEIGGGSAMVDILDFHAKMAVSNSEDFSLVVRELGLTFDSFILDGSPTGINSLEWLAPYRTPIGQWDFSGAGTNFAFEFAGDFLWINDLFAEHGFVVEQLTGEMIAAGNEWVGTGELLGGKYAPIPEPATIVLLAFGGLALWKRRK